MINRKYLLLALLTFIVFQVPSLKVYGRYVPRFFGAVSPLIIAGILVVALAGYLVYFIFLKRQGAQQILDSKSLLVLLIAVVLLSALMYPLVSYTEVPGKGSDQDEALIQATQRLLSGSYPYSELTYNSSPISTGPGLLLFGLPFAFKPGYIFFSLAYLSLSCVVLYRIAGCRRLVVSGFLILLLSSPLTSEMIVGGTDLIVVGCLFLLSAALVYYRYGRSALENMAIIFFIGLATTARVVFVYVVPIVALITFKRRFRDGLFLTAGAVAVNLTFHGIFYFWKSESYMPLHLIGKGSGMLGLSGLIVLGIGMLVLYAGAFMVRESGFGLYLLQVTALLGLPMAFSAFGSILLYEWDFGRWEGAHYLMPVFVVFAAAIALITSKEKTTETG